MNKDIISDLEAKLLKCKTTLSMLKDVKKNNLTKAIKEYEIMYSEDINQLKKAIKNAPGKYKKIIKTYEVSFDKCIVKYNEIMEVRE